MLLALLATFGAGGIVSGTAALAADATPGATGPEAPTPGATTTVTDAAPPAVLPSTTTTTTTLPDTVTTPPPTTTSAAPPPTTTTDGAGPSHPPEKRKTKKKTPGSGGGAAPKEREEHDASASAIADDATPPTAAPGGLLGQGFLGTLGLDSSLSSNASAGAVVQQLGLPGFLLPIYRAAGDRYGIPWQVLAAINVVETDLGRNPSVSSAGAQGWMQFMPSTWKTYGVDAVGHGYRDPQNPADAIFAAARYLRASGGGADLRKAIFSYNHSDEYVEAVLSKVRQLATVPSALADGATSLFDGRPPLAGGQAVELDRDGDRVVAAKIRARHSHSVLAVRAGTVVHIRRERSRGLTVRLRDDRGNEFTYSGLASVPQVVAASEATSKKRTRGASSTATSSKRRRGASSTASTAKRSSVGSRPGRRKGVVLRRLRPGTKVAAGAVIGRARRTATGRAVTFEVRPAGATRVDPRAILTAWSQLARTSAGAKTGTQPLFGPDRATADDGGSVVDPTQRTEAELGRKVLADPRIQIYACGRRDIEQHRIDRRVLALLLTLADSHLNPTVSSLECGHGEMTASGNVSEHSIGSAVDIAAINGVPILGHQGAGTVTDRTIRRILQLGPALAPHQVISLMTFPGQDTAFALPDHYNHIHVGYAQSATQAGTGQAAPAAPRASRSALSQALAAVKPGDWDQLLEQFRTVEQPTVAVGSSTDALPVTAGANASPRAAATFLTDADHRAAAVGHLTVRSVPASHAAPTTYVPTLGIPATNLEVIGAPADGEPGETWASGRVGTTPIVVGGKRIADTQVLLRRTTGTGTWSVVPYADGAGDQLPFDAETATVSPTGGVAALGQATAGSPGQATPQQLAIRAPGGPGGATTIAPAPSATGDDAVLAAGEQLFLASAAPSNPFAAIDDDGHTGALVAPVKADGSATQGIAGTIDLTAPRGIVMPVAGGDASPAATKASATTTATSAAPATTTDAHATSTADAPDATTTTPDATAATTPSATSRTDATPVTTEAAAPTTTDAAPTTTTDAAPTTTTGSTPSTAVPSPATTLTGTTDPFATPSVASPRAVSAATGPGVLHFDGTTWTREPLCATLVGTDCGVPTDVAAIVRIAAAPAGRGWLLARTPTGQPLVYQRVLDPSGPGYVWQQRHPQTWLLGGSGAPSGIGPASVTVRTDGAMLTATNQGVWVDLRVDGTTDATTLVSAVDPDAPPVGGIWCSATAVCGADAHQLGSAMPTGRYGSSAFQGTGDDPGTRIITGVGSGGLLRRDPGDAGFSYVVGGGAGGATSAFPSPDEGWLGLEGGGTSLLIHATTETVAPALSSWPVPFRRPLFAIATSPGATAGAADAPALAVGDQGQVTRYVPGTGWTADFLYDSSGARATPRLRGVAWPMQNRAYAVGDDGAMWVYNGQTQLWSPDGGRPLNFHGNLTGVAFSQTNPNRGYAVGKQGVLLRYDKTWTAEAAPDGLQGAQFTSVAFAGGVAVATYRIADPGSNGYEQSGGLIVNDGSGWRRDPDLDTLLASAYPAGKRRPWLARVAGLADGGIVAAGPGLVVERDGPGAPWRFSTQPPASGAVSGASADIVAIAAFREGGSVRALVSGDVEDSTYVQKLQQGDQVAPAAPGQPAAQIGPDRITRTGFLLRETADGWQDVQHEAFPISRTVDQPYTPDPVLALAVDPTGSRGWAVGGQTGITQADAPSLTAQTGAVQRLGGDASPPGATTAPIAAPAGQVSFAVGGQAACGGPCADRARQRIGPDTWLDAAVRSAGAIDGLHAFVYTGGRIAPGSAGNAAELARYAQVLRGTGAVRTFAAISPTDGSAAAFGAAMGALAPVGTAPTDTPAPPAGSAAYAVDSAGSGGAVRLIVLDYSQGTSPQLGPDQQEWLRAQLADAKTKLPAVVVGNANITDASATNYAADAGVVGQILAAGGASAYLFDSPGENVRQSITRSGTTVPAFGTGSLGYTGVPAVPQDDRTASGFLLTSVDVGARNAATNQAPVTATLIPNSGQLALDARDGQLLRRSSVSLFQGLARRPLGGSLFHVGSSGFDDIYPNPYVTVPQTCQGGDCNQFIPPAATFSSSNPDIGDFVRQDPASTNPRAVLQGGDGKPIPDGSSGLFCAFNSGTTTVTVTTGGLSSSAVVTVQAGSVAQPCGTVPLKDPPPAKAVTQAQDVPDLGDEPDATPQPDVSPDIAVPAFPARPSPPARRPQPKPRRRIPREPVLLAPLLGATPVPPVRGAVPPPAPSAGRPIPPNGGAQVPAQTPVSQPVGAPEREEEPEPAVEASHNMVAYRHDDQRLPPGIPIAAVIILAAAGAAVRTRRRGAAPVRAEARYGRRR
ncbi:lytic murein transglycosylase [Patulibacter sp. NPDC049589]|uniref:lytic murein transglycosylase n=1 Tax=Patulibacter sp. NPDC049589 TaxID=3154731 RepID=UPI00342FE630